MAREPCGQQSLTAGGEPSTAEVWAATGVLGNKPGNDQQAIVESLEDSLKNGAKQLVGNRGYRRFLRVDKGSVSTDEMKRRLAARGWNMEWNDIRHDMEAIAEVEVREGEESYLLRTPLQGYSREGASGGGCSHTTASAACLSCSAKDFICPQSPFKILCFSDKL